MGIDRAALSAAMKQRCLLPQATHKTSDNCGSSSGPPSPKQAGHKRLRDEDDDEQDDDDSEDDEARSMTNQPSNTPGHILSPASDLFSTTNLSAFTEKECKRAKLDVSETADVQEFSKLAIERKITKLYVKLLATQKKLSKLEDDKNIWEGPSKSLKSNIAKYAHAVLLSPDLHGYREKVAANHVLTIIKRHRFDLPRDIEKNRSNWAQVETAVGTALTARRRFFKEVVKKSLKEDWDIYTLAERLIGDSEANMTLELVARAAMMRSLYHDDEKTEGNFWIEMDKLLATIRTEADGDKLAASHGMKWFIDEDLRKYGRRDGDAVEERILDEDTPTWFEEVNQVVAGDGKRA